VYAAAAWNGGQQQKQGSIIDHVKAEHNNKPSHFGALLAQCYKPVYGASRGDCAVREKITNVFSEDGLVGKRLEDAAVAQDIVAGRQGSGFGCVWVGRSSVNCW